MIVVPRRREKRRRPRAKEEKREQIDEDLYKISPELLYAKRKKKGVLCLFSSCLMPTCVL
ncbi:hypothetical protein OIU84_011994 [Salix udensis]|uniref:Uncharacterized protein n=1 Tax=Salix udensis TaxID=889485 RepID=A0AAD6JF10_9ROSI|nr:hypothetical protein OIU84_011994 [Salix udensis]